MKFLIPAIISLSIFNAHATPFLSEMEAQKASDYLDYICMDTYCGGDINWLEPRVSCDDDGCNLDISAMSWYEDELLISPEDFSLLPEESKVSDTASLLSVSLEQSDMYSGEFFGPKVKANCKLEVENANSALTYREKEKAIYYATLDCVDEIQALIFSL